MKCKHIEKGIERERITCAHVIDRNRNRDKTETNCFNGISIDKFKE